MGFWLNVITLSGKSSVQKPRWDVIEWSGQIYENQRWIREFNILTRSYLRHMRDTIPETNISPENRPLEKEIPIGNHHF